METQIIMESNNEEETKMLDRNVMLCNCKQVSYADVEDALKHIDEAYLYDKCTAASDWYYPDFK